MKINVNNVGLMAFPVMEKDGRPTVRTFIEDSLAIPKTSKNKEAAARLISFLVYGNGIDILNQGFIVVPSKVGYKMPDNLVTTKEAKDGWALMVSLLDKSTTHRNNMSAFSDVIGAKLTGNGGSWSL